MCGQVQFLSLYVLSRRQHINWYIYY